MSSHAPRSESRVALLLRHLVPAEGANQLRSTDDIRASSTSADGATTATARACAFPCPRGCGVSAVPCSARAALGAPVVVGGMVLDVQGRAGAERALERGTTTPGQVEFRPGGVARNIGECMAALTAPPLLISAVGDDAAADVLLTHWASRGLSTHGIVRAAGQRTAVVASVFDGGGEVAAGVADVAVLEQGMQEQWIERFTQAIHAAPCLVVDTNLPPSLLAHICQLAAAAGVAVWCDPVSVGKAPRTLASLPL
ncbi:unnamed protein product, partial [Closterium sp. Naga37s-1]